MWEDFLSGRHLRSSTTTIGVLIFVEPALERGRKTFPRAHFVFYDRYNSHYNPTGVVDLPVPFPGRMFDFILAFSVFTHVSVREMLDLLDQLMSMLSGRR